MFTLHIHRMKQEVETLTDVVAIRLTSSRGDCEILTHHEPFFTTFLPPLLTIQEEDGTLRSLGLSEVGFLKIENDICDVWIL